MSIYDYFLIWHYGEVSSQSFMHNIHIYQNNFTFSRFWLCQRTPQQLCKWQTCLVQLNQVRFWHFQTAPSNQAFLNKSELCVDAWNTSHTLYKLSLISFLKEKTFPELCPLLVHCRFSVFRPLTHVHWVSSLTYLFSLPSINNIANSDCWKEFGAMKTF